MKYITLFIRKIYTLINTHRKTIMSSLAKTHPSIFISHVFPNKVDMVYETFSELFGSDSIDDVDVVTHEYNGQDICRVYVHFKAWPDAPKFQSLRTRLLNGETIKIVYDHPWYWKCVASKIPRIKSNSGMLASPKKRIVLDDTVTEPVVEPVTQSPVVTSDIPAKPTQPAQPTTSTWIDILKHTEAKTSQVTENQKQTKFYNVPEPETKTTPSLKCSHLEERCFTDTGYCGCIERMDKEIDENKVTTVPVIDIITMQAVQYEYCCYTRKLNLKTKEDFMNYLGGILFPVVSKISNIFGNKITGMLLEMEPEMIVKALEDKDLFNTYITKCYEILKEAIELEMKQLSM